MSYVVAFFVGCVGLFFAGAAFDQIDNDRGIAWGFLLTSLALLGAALFVVGGWS